MYQIIEGHKEHKSGLEIYKGNNIKSQKTEIAQLKDALRGTDEKCQQL